MVRKVIIYSFYLLFFLTPLIWTSKNFELFEYNKMLFTYFLTVVIVSSWIYRMIDEKKIIFKKTPLDIPLILFLIANILSTIFSIDQHISIWGYYSRSNGGLLSLTSYLMLYWALVSNIEAKHIPKMLISALSSGAIISLYAISEHFGVSPSCVLLRQEFNASCWVQDVQARVFASLGQPNWLAAYLGMLIFPALFMFLTSSSRTLQTLYYTLLVSLYLSFTFTYSRGATLGLVAAFVTFLGLNILKVPKPKPVLTVLFGFLIINLLFGSAFTRFQLDNLFIKSPTSPINQNTSSSIPASVGTQLENGGTESGQIRLIVWQGALEIFKKYPLFGSGVETFAYSYYQFRPKTHNLTSEWDFLYNKAHNEFLNYLANTGIIGFSTYLLIIIIFLIWSLKQIISGKNDLIYASLLASYISYLVQNLFGFSVVIIAIFFYLFPALVFVSSGTTGDLKLPKLLKFSLRPIYQKSGKIALVIIAFLTTFSIYRLWTADTLFALGQKSSEAGNAGRAYNLLSEAVDINPNEPFYRSELGYAAAQAAVALEDSDATLSAQLKRQALEEIKQAIEKSPNNVSFLRTAIRTYYQLASIDPEFNQKTLDTVDAAIKLAPTDPKLYYNKAIILGQLNKNEEAIKALDKALELKPNYREGYLALGLFYFDSAAGKKASAHFDQELTKKAVETMNIVLKLVPNDPEALDYLNEWGKQGVATKSADYETNK
ncbi:O-antigen ligase family protein [Candidatus Daviesbacteria bacterium]|nr:O-antigen ligase family protein [Candidatus Daviesbacteria bacterium]